MRNPCVILVIGASNGIGEATAKILSSRGHVVYGSSRDAVRVSADGVRALSVDIFDDASIAKAMDMIIKAEGQIDGVIYSAGFYCAGAVEETPMADVQAQMQAYFFGAVRCAQFILPQMRAQNSGRLIFMSSTAGSVAIPFHAAYSASKGALGKWTEALAYEVSPFNIHASYIEAGAIKTNAPNAMRSGRKPMEVYAAPRETAESYFKDALANGMPALRAAKAIANSFEHKRPKVRYRIGGAGKVFPVIQALIGERLFRRLMAKSFGI